MEALQRIQLNPLFVESNFQVHLGLNVLLYSATLVRNIVCMNEPSLKADFAALEQIKSLIAFSECQEWRPLRNEVCDESYFIYKSQPETESCADMLKNQNREIKRISFDWHSQKLCDPKFGAVLETMASMNLFASIFASPIVDVPHL